LIVCASAYEIYKALSARWLFGVATGFATGAAAAATSAGSTFCRVYCDTNLTIDFSSNKEERDADN